jgi:hypothetical protein
VKILVSLNLSSDIHRFVEKRGASPNNLISQVIYHGIPKASYGAAVSLYW